MENVGRTPYKAALAITVHCKVLTDQNYTRKWDGKPFLTVIGAGAFFRLTISKATRLLPTSEINYLPTANFCIDVITNTFHKIKCKISRYKDSFFPDSIYLWNNIIKNFQNAPPFASQKAHSISTSPKGQKQFSTSIYFSVEGKFGSTKRNHKTPSFY